MKSEKDLTSAEMQMILSSIADGVFTVDDKFIITSFNRAAQEITGVPAHEALGKPCCEVFRAEICEADCALKRTILTGKPVVNHAVFIVRANGQRVPISISTAVLRDEGRRVIGGVETFRDLTLVEALRREVEKSFTFEDIISKNHRMHQLFDILPDVADSASTVLLEGESGTGKELFARAIHANSLRAQGPFVVVDCASLPETLVESILFGHSAVQQGRDDDVVIDHGRHSKPEAETVHAFFQIVVAGFLAVSRHQVRLWKPNIFHGIDAQV